MKNQTAEEILIKNQIDIEWWHKNERKTLNTGNQNCKLYKTRI